MVSLLVGPQKQRMTVHREFLTRDSKFFQAALQEVWVEGPHREIKLPQESPTHMGYYIEHMYGIAPPNGVLTEKLQCLPKIDQHYTLLAELHALGGRRQDAKYQNTIMREFFRLLKLSRMAPGITGAKAIYLGTTEQSLARRLVVGFAARCENDCWVKAGKAGTQDGPPTRSGVI